VLKITRVAARFDGTVTYHDSCSGLRELGIRAQPQRLLAGGANGQIGENWVRRNDGRMQRLQGADATVLDAGEAVIIQTPTAGGYGKAR